MKKQILVLGATCVLVAACEPKADGPITLEKKEAIRKEGIIAARAVAEERAVQSAKMVEESAEKVGESAKEPVQKFPSTQKAEENKR